MCIQPMKYIIIKLREYPIHISAKCQEKVLFTYHN